MSEAIFAFLVGVLIAILAPTRHECPPGWYVNGAPPDGVTSCREIPPNWTCGEPPEPDCPEPRTYPVRVRCTGGSRPIVVDDRTVGCQR